MLLNNIIFRRNLLMIKEPKLKEIFLLDQVKKAITSGEYIVLPHARVRCVERDVSLADIEFILEKGRRIKSRDRFDERLNRWSYCFEGRTIDKEPARIIVAFIQKMAIVTVVKLGGKYE